MLSSQNRPAAPFVRCRQSTSQAAHYIHEDVVEIKRKKKDSGMTCDVLLSKQIQSPLSRLLPCLYLRGCDSVQALKEDKFIFLLLLLSIAALPPPEPGRTLTLQSAFFSFKVEQMMDFCIGIYTGLVAKR